MDFKFRIDYIDKSRDFYHQKIIVYLKKSYLEINLELNFKILLLLST